MNLDKAIELLRHLRTGLDLPLMTDEASALSLGIEALKRVQKSRKVYSRASIYLLPGETED